VRTYFCQRHEHSLSWAQISEKDLPRRHGDTESEYEYEQEQEMSIEGLLCSAPCLRVSVADLCLGMLMAVRRRVFPASGVSP